MKSIYYLLAGDERFETILKEKDIITDELCCMKIDFNSKLGKIILKEVKKRLHIK
jgi:hypothetical protein